MKTTIKLAALAAALALPALSFAQADTSAQPVAQQPAQAQVQAPDQPVTRAEVRGQLRQLEQAGYDPATADINYPDNIEAAQDRVDAQTAYGMSTGGTSRSGGPVGTVAPSSYSPPVAVYQGH